ncbi:MAG: helix-turn-helix domain-containing protein, partial [Gammaproteobacteria bacterium]
MKRRWRRLPPDKRRQIIQMAAQGASYRQIVDRLDVSSSSVTLVVKPLGGVTRKELWNPGTRRLSLDERIDIKLGLEGDRSLRSIAHSIKRDPATVCREVKA